MRIAMEGRDTIEINEAQVSKWKSSKKKDEYKNYKEILIQGFPLPLLPTTHIQQKLNQL